VLFSAGSRLRLVRSAVVNQSSPQLSCPLLCQLFCNTALLHVSRENAKWETESVLSHCGHRWVYLTQLHLISHQMPLRGKAQPRALLQRLPVMDLIDSSKKYISEVLFPKSLMLLPGTQGLCPPTSHCPPSPPAARLLGMSPPCAVLTKGTARDVLRQPQLL